MHDAQFIIHDGYKLLICPLISVSCNLLFYCKSKTYFTRIIFFEKMKEKVGGK